MLRRKILGYRFQNEAEEGEQGAGASGGNDAKASQLELELKAAKEEAAKHRAEAKKRKDANAKAEAEAAAAKAIEDGKASEKIKELQAELAKAQAENESHRAVFTAEVDKMFASLPKESQEALDKFRDKLDVADFKELVENQIKAVGSSGSGDESENTGEGEAEEMSKHLPPAATPAARQVKLNQGRELKPESKAILDDLGADYTVAKHLVEKNGVFGMGMKKFLTSLQEAAGKPTRPNLEALGSRDGK